VNSSASYYKNNLIHVPLPRVFPAGSFVIVKELAAADSRTHYSSLLFSEVTYTF
jgi:hypothetical protein